MARVLTLPPIPGVDGVYSLLSFLADVDACAKRLTDLESLRSEINGLVSAVAKVEDIERLHAQAESNLTTAKNALVQAETEAVSIRSKVDTEIRAERQKWEHEQQHKNSEMQARLYEHERDVIELNQQAKAVESAQAAAAKMMDEANRIWANATAMKAEYEKKITGLRAVIE